MKFNISIIMLICLLSSILICQETPDVDLPLTVSDNLGNSKELRYGLDPLATDGIDTELGEFILPPNPPAGGFDARFNLSSVLNSEATWTDYRYGVTPYTGEKTNYIQHQVSSGGTTITFEWDMPYEVTGLLQDLFGGLIVDIQMSGIGSYTLTNLAVNPVKMILTYEAVLPVELSLFTAFVIDNNIILNWKTETEVNNYGFEIERASSSTLPIWVWEKIGFVQGNGNSNSPKEYSYVDKNPIGGNKFQYRLKQIDSDGHFEYSSVVEIILIPKEFSLAQNCPNPFNPSTSIRYQVSSNTNVTIKVFDVLGNEVATLVDEYKTAGRYEVEFNVEQDSRPAMASGVYFYQVKAGDYVQTKKMLYLK